MGRQLPQVLAGASNAPIMSGLGRRPLIGLSHGNGGSAAMLAWLGEALASAGYIVAAVEHHGNTSTEAESAAAGFALGRMLTEESLSAIQLPVRIVVGSADHTAPATTNGRYLAARTPGAQFRFLNGAGHYTFLAECAPAGAAKFRYLCQDSSEVDRGAMHRLVAEDAIRFFNGVLRH